MLIAQEKLRTNIAEYLLYMWQVEDMIRACRFDPVDMETRIVSQFNQPDKIKAEIRSWYLGLAESMQREGIQQGGHISFLRKIIEELNQLHERLLENPDETLYREQYHWATPNIREFRTRAKGAEQSDIEICFNGLYALLLLRLHNKEISIETREAMTTFSNLIAVLSKKYSEEARQKAGMN
jgi:hypothetical protein